MSALRGQGAFSNFMKFERCSPNRTPSHSCSAKRKPPRPNALAALVPSSTSPFPDPARYSPLGLFGELLRTRKALVFYALKSQGYLNSDAQKACRLPVATAWKILQRAIAEVKCHATPR